VVLDPAERGAQVAGVRSLRLAGGQGHSTWKVDSQGRLRFRVAADASRLLRKGNPGGTSGATLTLASHA
jgi:hypothetical protein